MSEFVPRPFEPITPEELPNFVGKKIHLSWAYSGCQWKLIRLLANSQMELQTPKTNKTFVAKQSDAVKLRAYETPLPNVTSVLTDENQHKVDSFIESMLLSRKFAFDASTEKIARITQDWVQQKLRINISFGTALNLVRESLAKQNLKQPPENIPPGALNPPQENMPTSWEEPG